MNVLTTFFGYHVWFQTWFFDIFSSDQNPSYLFSVYGVIAIRRIPMNQWVWRNVIRVWTSWPLLWILEQAMDLCRFVVPWQLVVDQFIPPSMRILHFVFSHYPGQVIFYLLCFGKPSTDSRMLPQVHVETVRPIDVRLWSSWDHRFDQDTIRWVFLYCWFGYPVHWTNPSVEVHCNDYGCLALKRPTSRAKVPVGLTSKVS